MEIACAAHPLAPERGADRARRIGQVKFVALVLHDPQPWQPAEPSPASRPGLFPAWRAFLSRVMGRLVAARP